MKTITRAHWSRVFLTVTLIGASVLAFPQSTLSQELYSHGNPTDLEQYMLELINRARQDPTAEGIFLDTLNTYYTIDARYRKPAFFTNLRQEFQSYPVAQPLPFNASLIQAARAHASDMIARKYFAHVTPEGKYPWDRAADAGYDSTFVGENMHSVGATSSDNVLYEHFSLMVDYDNLAQATSPLGHRLNILNPIYSEIGVGIIGTLSNGKTVQDFGDAGHSFVLGVVYNDLNHNGFYDPGEGLAGATINLSIGHHCAITSSSGGYAIPLDPEETRTDTVLLTVPAEDGWTDEIAAQDTAFRAQFTATNKAPGTVIVSASGGALTNPLARMAAMTRLIQLDYKLKGTDGWYFNRTLLVGRNTKVDFNSAAQCIPKKLNVPIMVSNNAIRLSWQGGTAPYQIQKRASITQTNWQNVGVPVTETSCVLSNNESACFYRVISN